MRLGTLAHNTTLMSKPVTREYYEATLVFQSCFIMYIAYIEKGRRLVNKNELWNEEYRDGIKTRGDKIGMALYIK